MQSAMLYVQGKTQPHPGRAWYMCDRGKEGRRERETNAVNNLPMAEEEAGTLPD